MTVYRPTRMLCSTQIGSGASINTSPIFMPRVQKKTPAQVDRLNEFSNKLGIRVRTAYIGAVRTLATADSYGSVIEVPVGIDQQRVGWIGGFVV